MLIDMFQCLREEDRFGVFALRRFEKLSAASESWISGSGKCLRAEKWG